MVLFQRFAWIAVSRVVAAALQAVALVLIARVTGPSQFGILASFIGLVIIIQVVSDGGIGTYILRLRVNNPNSNQISLALKVHQVFGILACVLLIVASVILANATGLLWWLLIPLAVAGYVERQGDVRLTLAIADGDVWKNALGLTLRRLLTLIGVLVGFHTTMDAIFYFGLATLLGSLFSLWLSRRVIDCPRYVGRFGLLECRQLFSACRPFWVNSIGVQLRNLDVVLVATLATPVVAGYYGSVARSLSPLMMISSSLATVLLPIAAGAKGKIERSLVIPVALVLSLVSIFYIGMAYYADEIVLLLFGPQYGPAAGAFRIAVLGLVFSSTSSLLTSLLQARALEQYVAFVSILTSLLSLVAISMGVCFYGLIGAATGLAFAYVVQAVLLVARVIKSQPIFDDGGKTVVGTRL
ncbi:oligosaccharide flippase family protein [Kocuria oceani]|uniref:Oligosaccharide flippase family protein n=1 Tax=Kocuria oceani TaxID=988827 RepID=A0ABV9TEB5_9MICC|nr:oligosaccharide flippase family protein [Kocuria oceani]